MREAGPEDKQHITRLASTFNDRYYPVPLNTDKFGVFYDKLMASDEGVILMTDTGAIVGVVAEDPIRDWVSLVEIGWYSEGGDGLRLLKAFEQVARDRQLNEVRMSTLIWSPPQAQKLLTHRGYIHTESSHTLIIE